MKNLGLVLLLVLAGYGAYALYHDHIKASFNPSINQAFQPTIETTKKIHSAISSNPPVSSSRRIVCPTCSGEGRLTYVDDNGKNHSYSCPICGFQGSNTIHMPEGAHICADCRGMGKTEIRKERADVVGYLITASRCQRCIGAGWILPRSAPGSKQPTPWVTPPQPAR